MDASEPRWPSCQSCGMPMENPEDFGTNKDKSSNSDYCHFCFQNGKFTEPDITKEQMISRVAGFMAQLQDVERSHARKVAEYVIAKLERWQTKQ